MRACAQAGVPWVARGAGSGLSGGALPVEDGVLIVLSRLKRILEIDLENQRVCVEPGVTNAAVSTARSAPELLLPARPVEPDRLLDRRQRRRELGRRALLQVRLHDELRLRPRARAARRRAGHSSAARSSTRRATTCSARSSAPRARSASPPRSWLRVVPAPETVAHAGRVLRLHARRPARRCRRSCRPASCPGAIEMMDELAIEAAEQMAHAGYPMGRGAALLVELDGAERECEARFEEVVAICERCGSDDVRVARDEAERAAVLEDAQGGVPGDGPHLAQLLRPGRRDPAHQAARGARAHRRARARSTG